MIRCQIQVLSKNVYGGPDGRPTFQFAGPGPEIGTEMDARMGAGNLAETEPEVGTKKGFGNRPQKRQSKGGGPTVGPPPFDCHFAVWFWYPGFGPRFWAPPSVFQTNF